MIATAEAIRLICGGWVEDAARAAYDRLPMATTLYPAGRETGQRIWWARADYAGNAHWAGIKKEVRQPVVRVGLVVGEIGIRWAPWT